MNTRYWTRIIDAFFFSCHGLQYAFKHERAFQQELMLAAVLIPLALWLPVNALERILLIVSVLFILVIELLNSAIEATVNRISKEQHELSRLAKDLSSAAVMVSLMITGIIWGTILLNAYHGITVP